ALENPTGVVAQLALHRREVRPIANQAAGIGKNAPRIDSRNDITRCQRHELLVPAVKEWVAADEKPTGVPLDEGRECCVDFAFSAGLEDRELNPLCACRFLHCSDD